MSRKKALVLYNLSTLLDAGIDVSRSLAMSVDGEKGKWKRVLGSVGAGVGSGQMVSEAMSEHRVFDELDVKMVEAAEQSGNLSSVMRSLSDYYQFMAKMKGLITAGLVRPFVILNIAAFVAPLPGLFRSGNFSIFIYLCSVFGILSIFYIPAAILFLMIKFRKVGWFRNIADYIFLKVPVLGAGLYNLAIGRFCRIFNMLISAGIPAVGSSEVAAGLCGNGVLERQFSGGALSARRGRCIGEGFSRKLPFDFLNMWKTGEDSGGLDVVSKKMADIYIGKAEFMFEEFSRWFPRFVGFLVALLLIYLIFKTMGTAY